VVGVEMEIVVEGGKESAKTKKVSA